MINYSYRKNGDIFMFIKNKKAFQQQQILYSQPL